MEEIIEIDEIVSFDVGEKLKFLMNDSNLTHFHLDVKEKINMILK